MVPCDFGGAVLAAEFAFTSRFAGPRLHGMG